MITPSRYSKINEIGYYELKIDENPNNKKIFLYNQQAKL